MTTRQPIRLGWFADDEKAAAARRGERVMELRGSVALVTGAAAGTGRAIALRLATEGAPVVVADVDAEGARDAVRAIEQAGGTARSIRADVTASDDVARMVEIAEEELGGLRVLVNNAGGGAVVNVASTAGVGFGPHPSPEYAAAKAGLIRFTAALAALPGVRVNCVVPDWIATDRALDELERMTAAEREAAPVPRPPEEIAAAVADLARDDALAGRVLVMWPGEPPRLLDPELKI
jgi:NAD(P)-dependent dehydrogenase (short-subunit alcohol dehydrogenase family)